MTATIITIDGPSGAGKGTIAYRLAEYFGFDLLDSGALYRIVGLIAHQNGLLDKGLSGDELDVVVADLVRQLTLSFVVNAQTKAVDIIVNGEPLKEDIRNETVGAYASKVATLPSVRTALLALQRNTTGKRGVVADGRDMGTVIFPEAAIKIFLTASSTARADRRVKQLQLVGKIADYDKILADIVARDEQDSNRAVAPLKPADDAVIIDSSTLTADEVFAEVLAICAKRGLTK